MNEHVLRLDHLLGVWPAWNAKLAILRVSTPDYQHFAERLSPEMRRPMFMVAPVECAPELPEGVAVAGFDTGHVTYFRIEWSEL